MYMLFDSYLTGILFSQTPMFYFYSFLRSGIWTQVTFRGGFDHEDASQRIEVAQRKALSTHIQQATANIGTDFTVGGGGGSWLICDVVGASPNIF